MIVTDNMFFERLSTRKLISREFFEGGRISSQSSSGKKRSHLDLGASDSVYSDRGDDDRADDYFLNIIGPPHLLAAVS